jgi:hypothetical protein
MYHFYNKFNEIKELDGSIMERSKEKLTEVFTNKVTTKVNLSESMNKNSIALE